MPPQSGPHRVEARCRTWDVGGCCNPPGQLPYGYFHSPGLATKLRAKCDTDMGRDKKVKMAGKETKRRQDLNGRDAGGGEWEAVLGGWYERTKKRRILL